MNRDEKNLDTMLDRAIAGIRNDQPDAGALQDAARRVWDQVEQAVAAPASRSVDRIRSCADFQALFPGYRARQLPQARALLVEDHIHECVACRKALSAAPADRAPKVVAMPGPRPALLKYGIAAALSVGMGLSSFWAWQEFGPGPSGSRAVVQDLNGTMYRVSGAGLRLVAAGEELAEHEMVRTASGTRAILKLRDGSLMELGERAELSISARRNDTTVNLERGKLIVEAAKRRAGHLYVASADCRVSVTGTIFAVNRGTKGSRVSVVEGEVRVQHAGNEQVLHPGEQTATHPSMNSVAVQDEIAWSRKYDEYLALLREFAALKTKLENVRLPGLHYSSALLDLAPANTVVYAGIPNLGQALSEANRLFQEQIRQSEVLRSWWEKKQQGHAGLSLDEFIEKIKTFSDYLGEEIVFAVPMSSTGGDQPVFIAEVRRAGLREFIDREMQRLGDKSYRIAEDTRSLATAPRGQILILLRGNYIAVAQNPALLTEMALRFDKTGMNPFASTAFRNRVRDAYSAGTGLLIAADLERIAAQTWMADAAAQGQLRRDAMQKAGLADVRYLVAQERQVSGTTQQSATIIFRGERRGFASWLASPGPMGSLSFVTPDAQFATSVVVKNPAQLLDDLLQFVENRDGRAQSELADAQVRLGINLRDDIAAALGGEATFAFDGPMLPVPAWKVVVEVTQPSRLQTAIERITAEANREAQGHGKRGVQIRSETAAGQVYYTIAVLDPAPVPEIHYVFTSGFLVAAPTRALLQQAIQIRAGGNYLSRAPRFLNLLPSDRHANFSALLYQNAGPLLGLMSAGLQATDQGTPEQRRAAADVAQQMGPSLICAYGDATRIEVASKGSFVNFGMQALFPALLNGTMRQPSAYPK